MNLTPLQAVRDYYQSLVPGRRQELMELLDPHVVIEVPEGFPGGGGTFTGLKAYIEDFLFALYGTFDAKFLADEFVDSGDQVAVIGRQQGLALPTRTPVDVPFVHLWTVRQGHLVRGRFFTDTALLYHALGTPLPARGA